MTALKFPAQTRIRRAATTKPALVSFQPVPVPAAQIARVMMLVLGLILLSGAALRLMAFLF